MIELTAHEELDGLSENTSPGLAKTTPEYAKLRDREFQIPDHIRDHTVVACWSKTWIALLVIWKGETSCQLHKEQRWSSASRPCKGSG